MLHWSSVLGCDERRPLPLWHIRLGAFDQRSICGANEAWALDRVDPPRSTAVCPRCAALEPVAFKMRR